MVNGQSQTIQADIIFYTKVQEEMKMFGYIYNKLVMKSN